MALRPTSTAHYCIPQAASEVAYKHPIFRDESRVLSLAAVHSDSGSFLEWDDFYTADNMHILLRQHCITMAGKYKAYKELQGSPGVTERSLHVLCLVEMTISIGTK